MYSFSGLALSQDSTYGCWRKVWFRYGLDLRGSTTPALEFGKATHGVISTMLTHGNDTKDALLECIRASMDFTNEDMDDMRKCVDANIITSVPEGEVEEYFELNLDDTPFTPQIRGFIDFYFIEDGKIHLYDWKTNRSMYEPQDTHQLGLYALHLSEKYKLPVVGSLAFLRFNIVRTHEYTPKDIENARKWALETALEYDMQFQRVENGESIDTCFPKQPGKPCEYCGYKNLCLEIPILPEAITSPDEASQSLQSIVEFQELLKAQKELLKEFIKTNGEVKNHTYSATINTTEYLRFDLKARKAVVEKMLKQNLDIGSILKIGSDAQKDLQTEHGWTEEDFIILGAKKGSTTKLSIEKL